MKLPLSLQLNLGFVLALAACGAQAAEQAPVFKPIASFAHYAIRQSSPFFSGEARSWMETSARLGGRLESGAFAFEAVALGLRTSGHDPYGSGSAPAGSPPGTPRPGNDPQFAFDTLYAQYTGAGEQPLKLAVGRQPIVLGSQFLVGDGVYDGFHRRHAQAVYHNPRRSFDAVRLEADTDFAHVDAFAYRMHPTWDGGGEWNGWFGGAELSRRTEGGGAWATGLFRRESRSALDNDMWVLALRGEQPLPELPGWQASAEWVGERGTGRNAFYVTTLGQRLREQAWHIEVGWQSERPLRPFAEAGLVRYSEDFTPVAQGFSDWGKWYLGNQIDWIIFSTNTRVARAQAGFWPHPQVKLRMQYHRTWLVSGPGGALSDEASLIGEWFPDERTWVSLLAGYARPHDALARAGLVNPFSFVNTDAVPVGRRSSLDLVFAIGMTF